MAHTRQYLTDNHKFEITCFCPVSREMMITFQYQSDEESEIVFKKIRNAENHVKRQIILLMEMAKTPYQIEYNEGFTIPLRDFWFGEN